MQSRCVDLKTQSMAKLIHCVMLGAEPEGGEHDAGIQAPWEFLNLVLPPQDMH